MVVAERRRRIENVADCWRKLTTQSDLLHILLHHDSSIPKVFVAPPANSQWKKLLRNYEHKLGAVGSQQDNRRTIRNKFNF